LTSLERYSRLQAILQVSVYKLYKKSLSLARQAVTMLLNAETGMHPHPSQISIHPFRDQKNIQMTEIY
jgi:hypothetical protein